MRQHQLLRYYYINKAWMVSGMARRVYRLSAFLSVTTFFMIVIVQVAGDIPPALRLWAKTLLFVGLLGTAITMMAMEYFLFSLDDSPAIKQVFWFCAMLFPFFGPALYCFIVYSRSAALQANQVKPVAASAYGPPAPR